MTNDPQCATCNGSGLIPGFDCHCTPENSMFFSECSHEPEPCPECTWDHVHKDGTEHTHGPKNVQHSHTSKVLPPSEWGPARPITTEGWWQ